MGQCTAGYYIRSRLNVATMNDRTRDEEGCREEWKWDEVPSKPLLNINSVGLTLLTGGIKFIVCKNSIVYPTKGIKRAEQALELRHY